MHVRAVAWVTLTGDARFRAFGRQPMRQSVHRRTFADRVTASRCRRPSHPRLSTPRSAFGHPLPSRRAGRWLGSCSWDFRKVGAKLFEQSAGAVQFVATHIRLTIGDSPPMGTTGSSDGMLRLAEFVPKLGDMQRDFTLSTIQPLRLGARIEGLAGAQAGQSVKGFGPQHLQSPLRAPCARPWPGCPWPEPPRRAPGDIVRGDGPVPAQTVCCGRRGPASRPRRAGVP